MCDAVAVGVNDCEEVGSGGLDDRFISDRIVCFAAKSSGASLLRCRNSMGRHFIHHGLPVSLSHFWIVCGEVGASQTEIEGRLPMRFVHGIQEAFGFASLACAKRSLLARIVFLPVKNAVTPAVQSIFELHVFLHVEENEHAEFFPLASSGGVATELVRIVHPQGDLLAFIGFSVLPAGETAHLKQFKIGSRGRIRTYDQSVNSRPLYH